jgi:hypothetical protein
MTPERSVPKRKTTFDCTECGMLQEGAMFHPYWHCVLYKAGIDPRHLDPPDPRLATLPAAPALLAALRALVSMIDSDEVSFETASTEWWDTIEQARALLRDLSPEEEGQ